jgi:hypothetical protein
MQEQRKWPRKPIEANAFLYGSDGQPIGPCRLKDVSVGGALLAHSIGTELPREFILSLSRDGQVRRHCRIAWQTKEHAGVRFIAIGTR